MNKIKIIFSIFLLVNFSFSQDYAPAAGKPGSTALKFDSTIFVAWATGIELRRGYVNIEDTSVYYQGANLATFGEPEDALGIASGNSIDGVVSLGDSGVAILTFSNPITNGEGWDFAVFENGVNDNFLELAFVEVSSDGVHFVRFPAHSQTQTNTPVGTFGSIDPTYIHNLAGKYRVGYGTPFDLEELKDSANLDITKITHVKIVDVVGSLGEKGTKDHYGNKINDLFPTPFNSGGFDLAGVGVIHENKESSGVDDFFLSDFKVYPNPSSGWITIQTNVETEKLIVYNNIGKVLHTIQLEKQQNSQKIKLNSGIYFIQAIGTSENTTKKIVVR